MKLLALDSTTDRITLALLDDGSVLGGHSYPAGRYSETILPSLDSLLSEAGINLEAVEGLAVDIGPGSFTGVRVGIATAKALAQAARRPLVGLPALDVLARQQAWEGTVVAALDAKRGEVYWAPYEMPPDRPTAPPLGPVMSDRASSPVSTSPTSLAPPPRLSAVEAFCREVEALGGPVFLVGTVLLLPEVTDWPWPSHVTLGSDAESRPQASTLGSLAAPLLRGLGWESLFSVQPLYWRPADALKLSERKARSR